MGGKTHGAPHQLNRKRWHCLQRGGRHFQGGPPAVGGLWAGGRVVGYCFLGKGGAGVQLRWQLESRACHYPTAAGRPPKSAECMSESSVVCVLCVWLTHQAS